MQGCLLGNQHQILRRNNHILPPEGHSPVQWQFAVVEHRIAQRHHNHCLLGLAGQGSIAVLVDFV